MKLSPLIFIHVPKAAGTSLAKAFGVSTKHHLARDLKPGGMPRDKDVIDPTREAADWEHSFTFAVVRNPYTQAASWWNNAVRKQATTMADLSFRQWMLEGCPCNSVCGGVGPLDQEAFFCTETGGQLVNYVGRFEDLDEAVEVVARHLGETPPLLEHHNPTHYATSLETLCAHYDEPDVREAAITKFAPFCERWGYGVEPISLQPRAQVR